LQLLGFVIVVTFCLLQVESESLEFSFITFFLL
jgi:hypothetical protein